MLLHGITGACIAGIPLAILLIFQCYLNVGLNNQIICYKEKEKENLYLSVWVLKEDIAAGKKITRSDLVKDERWVPKTGNINKLTDIKQIIGRKAKKALKKGMIMRTELFYNK